MRTLPTYLYALYRVELGNGAISFFIVRNVANEINVSCKANTVEYDTRGSHIKERARSLPEPTKITDLFAKDLISIGERQNDVHDVIHVLSCLFITLYSARERDRPRRRSTLAKWSRIVLKFTA